MVRRSAFTPLNSPRCGHFSLDVYNKYSAVCQWIDLDREKRAVVDGTALRIAARTDARTGTDSFHRLSAMAAVNETRTGYKSTASRSLRNENCNRRRIAVV